MAPVEETIQKPWPVAGTGAGGDGAGGPGGGAGGSGAAGVTAFEVAAGAPPPPVAGVSAEGEGMPVVGARGTGWGGGGGRGRGGGAARRGWPPPLCGVTVGVPGAAGGPAAGQVVHTAATDQTGWISFGLLLKACVSMTHGPTRRTWVPRAGGVSE